MQEMKTADAGGGGGAAFTLFLHSHPNTFPS